MADEVETEAETEEFPPTSRRRRVLWILGIVVAVLVISVSAFLFVFFQTAEQPDSRSQECRDRGGIFVNNGRYGDPFCVKDGKIITIWKRYGPVQNP